MKYLPSQVSSTTTSKQGTRSSFGSGRLDANGLKKLEQQNNLTQTLKEPSPVRGNSLQRITQGIVNVFRKSSASRGGPSSVTSNENKFE